MNEMLVGTFLGAFLGGIVAFGITRWQMAQEAKLARDAYLRNLREELDENTKTVWEVKSYLVEGPQLEHLFSPALVTATYLQTTGWTDLVRAGVLSGLAPSDRRLFRGTDRAIKRLRKAVEVRDANLPRVIEWRTHDLEMGNPQPAQVKLYLSQAFDELRYSADYAMEKITAARVRLDQLLGPFTVSE